MWGNGEALQDEWADNQTPLDDTPNDQTPDKSSENETSKDETSADETTRNGASEHETSGNDTSWNDISWNDTSGNDTSGNGTSGNDTSGNGTSGNDTSGNDASGDETSGNDASENETSGNDASENEMSGNDASENETSGNDASENGTSGNDTSENETSEDVNSDGETLTNEVLADEISKDESSNGITLDDAFSKNKTVRFKPTVDQSSKDINQPASAFSAPFFPKSILKKTVPETGNNPNDTRDSCGSDGDNDGDDDSDGSDESDDSDEAGDSRGQDGSNGDGGSGDQAKANPQPCQPCQPSQSVIFAPPITPSPKKMATRRDLPSASKPKASSFREDYSNPRDPCSIYHKSTPILVFGWGSSKRPAPKTPPSFTKQPSNTTASSSSRQKPHASPHMSCSCCSACCCSGTTCCSLSCDMNISNSSCADTSSSPACHTSSSNLATSNPPESRGQQDTRPRIQCTNCPFKTLVAARATYCSVCGATLPKLDTIVPPSAPPAPKPRPVVPLPASPAPKPRMSSAKDTRPRVQCPDCPYKTLVSAGATYCSNCGGTLPKPDTVAPPPPPFLNIKPTASAAEPKDSKPFIPNPPTRIRAPSAPINASKPAMAGNSAWTPEQNTILMSMKADNKSWKEISDAVSKDVGAAKAQYKELLKNKGATAMEHKSEQTSEASGKSYDIAGEWPSDTQDTWYTPSPNPNLNTKPHDKHPESPQFTSSSSSNPFDASAWADRVMDPETQNYTDPGTFPRAPIYKADTGEELKISAALRIARLEANFDRIKLIQVASAYYDETGERVAPQELKRAFEGGR